MTERHASTVCTKPIRVIQLNTQKNKNNLLMLLNRVDDPTDIVILQEPPWSFIGTDRKNGNQIDGPPGMAGWVPILPVPARSPDDPRPPTMAYVRQREDFTVELHTDIIEDPYIQWLDIHQTGKRDITIINIYNV
ncbi:hypothetical protein L218DRAFT_1008509 [Marasmius fiardii PR-910]|nr:hypothetical protein L218DRAFT_1008509 [Marasmius fiardii PR-910]